MPLLLVVVFSLGLIICLPSGVINLREQETIFPLIGIALFLACLIFRNPNPDHPRIGGGAAGKIVGLSLVFVVIHIISIFTPDSYRLLLIIALYGFLYYAVVTNYAEIQENKNLIYNLICIFALLNVLWLALQVNKIYIIFYPTSYFRDGGQAIQTGFFANRNEVSVYLAASLPFFFRGKWHYGIIPVLAGLVAAQTTTGAIGAVIVLAVYGIILLHRKGWKIKWIVLPGLIFSIVAISAYMKFVHQGGYGGRLSAYQKSLELVEEKPLWGWGITQGKYVIPLYLNGDRQKARYLVYAYKHVVYHLDFKNVYLKNPIRHKTDEVIWTHLHNDPIQWAVEAGLIGLALALAVIIAHAFAFFRTKRWDLCAGLSLLVLLWSCNAFFTFQIGRFSFLAVFLLAMIQGRYLFEKSLNQRR